MELCDKCEYAICDFCLHFLPKDKLDELCASRCSKHGHCVEHNKSVNVDDSCDDFYCFRLDQERIANFEAELDEVWPNNQEKVSGNIRNR